MGLTPDGKFLPGELGMGLVEGTVIVAAFHDSYINFKSSLVQDFLNLVFKIIKQIMKICCDPRNILVI